jgi:glycosyltransferase involved in cell wall biosynthesis
VISLVMIVRDEAKMIRRCLQSVKPLISSWTIVDTGSRDETQKIVRKALRGTQGELHEREFVDFAHNRTEALALARGSAEWLLLLDADMTAEEVHPELLTFLAEDPDPEVGAWMVSIWDGGTTWRLPALIRGDREWRFIEPVHEYLDTSGVKTRSLLGLTLYHHGGSRHPIEKFDHYLKLLKPGVKKGNPRSIFYSAECYRFLGCIPEAIDFYTRRSQMNGHVEEEAWYAQYQAAKLSRNVTDLYQAYLRRPWRPEPLQAAADLVREQPNDDILFLETR